MENSAIRIYSLNKTERVGSTKDNCKEFRVLPIIFLYEKYSLSFILKMTLNYIHIKVYETH